MDAIDSNTGSTPDNIKDFRHVTIEIAMVGFTGTINFVGSIAESIPDFTSAASITNPYDNIQVNDLEDSASIAGDTGITGSATTDVRIVEANINALKWFGVKTSSVTAGSVTVKITPFND